MSEEYDAETVRQMRQDHDADLELRAKIEPIRQIVVRIEDEDGVKFDSMQIAENSWSVSPTRGQLIMALVNYVDDAFDWLARRDPM